MMVAVTLLAIIMIGLLTMFQQTQRALHVAVTQTDVFENIRGAIQLVSRDLSEMTAYGDDTVIHTYAKPVPSPAGTLTLPAGGPQPLDLNEAFWLTRVNDDWQGIGFYVADDPLVRTNYGVGTLYRFSGQARRAGAELLQAEFFKPQPTNSHRVSDGIVHFSLEAGYVIGTNNQGRTIYGQTNKFAFASNDLPAFVDVEIGVLEPATLKQFQSISLINVANAQTFLRDHVGKIHFFRERVPIRNFINPYRSNEVP